MFDRSFDGATNVTRAPERKPVTLKPDQLDTLKQESWDSGFSAGQKATGDVETQKLAAIFAQIDSRLAALAANAHAAHLEQEKLLRRAVIAVARKLLPDFTARNGVQEIDALLTETIGQMLREPRLVVRVHESQFDTINARINEISAQKAYPGKVVVLADDGIAPGDCLVEWADGGVERNTAATWQDIEKAVAPDQNPNQTAGE
jgi:flagellar assembly protein FliH